MDTKLLVSRVIAAVDRGRTPDGAVLAAEYNAAVGGVVARLEAVQTAVEEGQTSEAVRIMEDEPRLLDEVSALQFLRFSEWEVLCANCRWPVPEKIDPTLLEKVALFAEGKDVVEPLLRMYRKAMRMHDVKLSVRALRRLVERDHSQDWSAELATAEDRLKNQLLQEFIEAERTGNGAGALRLASVLFEDAWVEPVTGPEFLPAKMLYLAERRRERQERIGAYAVALASCLTDEWDRSRARALVEDIEAECVEGVTLTEDQRALVDRCRARYEDEEAGEVAEAEARRATAWRAARKKMVIRVVSVIAAALVLIFACAATYVVRTAHERGCQAELMRMESLLTGVDPVEKLAAEIARVQADYPKIWADARISVYADRLAALKESWTIRTNEIAEALGRLEALRAESWPESSETVAKNALDGIAGKIRPEDAFAKERYQSLQDAFAEVVKRRQIEREEKAEAFGGTMMAQVKAVSDRLSREFMTADLEKQVTAVRATMDEWEKKYAAFNPQSAADFASARETFEANARRQIEAQTALEALRTAASPEALEQARKTLCATHRDYGDVAKWRPVWATAERIKDVFASDGAEMKAFRSRFSVGVDAAEFKSFVGDVAQIKEMDAWYSLYGVREEGEAWYNVFAKGRPKVEPIVRSSGARAYRISGTLLLAVRLEVREEYEWTLSKQWRNSDGDILVTKSGVKVNRGNTRIPVRLVTPSELLPYSQEFRRLCQQVSGDVSLKQDELAEIFLGKIGEHLKAAASDEWVSAERKALRIPYLKAGRYPAYARVQMLDRYIGWLRDLHYYGDGAPCAKQVRECERLARPVSVDGVEDSLSWLCTNNQEVRDRNEACVDLLKSFPADFAVQVGRWNRTRRNVSRHMDQFSLQFAGTFVQDPAAFSDYPGQIWFSVPAEHAGSSLYVLREGGTSGKTVLKRALEPAGSTWRRAAGMEAEFIPGEPLFTVQKLNVAVQPEGILQGELGELDGELARRLAGEIPFVEL